MTMAGGRSVAALTLIAAVGLGSMAAGCSAGAQPRRDGPGQAAQGPGQPARTNYADELTDFGVAPKTTMERNVGTPTPTTIPGGHVITTREVKQAVGSQILLIDVLDGPHPSLPGALFAPGAGMGGDFNDGMQRQFGQWLASATKNNRSAPIVFVCAGSRCWESYNAALRALRLGYTTVLWYRGGLAAWRAAGGPLVQSQGAGGAGQGGPGQGGPGQGYSGQGYPGQGGPPQGYPGQGGPGQGYPGQGYPGQGGPPQGYPGQGGPPQGYPGQGGPGQGGPGQGGPGQGYPGQGYPGQGGPGQGYPGQSGPGQGYPGQGGPPPGYPG